MTMITYDYESLIKTGKWATHHFVNFPPAKSATWLVEVFKYKHRGKRGGYKHQP